MFTYHLPLRVLLLPEGGDLRYYWLFSQPNFSYYWLLPSSSTNSAWQILSRNKMLFYCHLSPFGDNKLIMNTILMIIAGDNRVIIAVNHAFYCHFTPISWLITCHFLPILLPITCYLSPVTYYLLLITCYLLPVTYYLLLITYYTYHASSESWPYTTNTISYQCF